MPALHMPLMNPRCCLWRLGPKSTSRKSRELATTTCACRRGKTLAELVREAVEPFLRMKQPDLDAVLDRPVDLPTAERVRRYAEVRIAMVPRVRSERRGTTCLTCSSGSGEPGSHSKHTAAK